MPNGRIWQGRWIQGAQGSQGGAVKFPSWHSQLATNGPHIYNHSPTGDAAVKPGARNGYLDVKPDGAAVLGPPGYMEPPVPMV